MRGFIELDETCKAIEDEGFSYQEKRGLLHYIDLRDDEASILKWGRHSAFARYLTLLGQSYLKLGSGFLWTWLETTEHHEVPYTRMKVKNLRRVFDLSWFDRDELWVRGKYYTWGTLLQGCNIIAKQVPNFKLLEFHTSVLRWICEGDAADRKFLVDLNALAQATVLTNIQERDQWVKDTLALCSSKGPLARRAKDPEYDWMAYGLKKKISDTSQQDIDILRKLCADMADVIRSSEYHPQVQQLWDSIKQWQDNIYRNKASQNVLVGTLCVLSVLALVMAFVVALLPFFVLPALVSMC